MFPYGLLPAVAGSAEIEALDVWRVSSSSGLPFPLGGVGANIRDVREPPKAVLLKVTLLDFVASLESFLRWPNVSVSK